VTVCLATVVCGFIQRYILDLGTINGDDRLMNWQSFKKLIVISLIALFPFVLGTQSAKAADISTPPTYAATFRFPTYSYGPLLDWVQFTFLNTQNQNYDYYNLDGSKTGGTFTLGTDYTAPIQVVGLDLRTGTIYLCNTDNPDHLNDWILPVDENNVLLSLSMSSGTTVNTSAFTIKFVDDQTGKQLAPDETNSIAYKFPDGMPDPLSNLKTALYNTDTAGHLVTSRTFSGYALATTPLTNDGSTYTYHYVKSKPSTSSPIVPATNSANVSSSSQKSDEGNQVSKQAPIKGSAITSTRKIGLYKTANFTQSNRKYWYPQQVRTKRPQFIITGYARSKHHTLRYKVCDVNHTRKTDKQTGYITANSTYVTSTYYQQRPKSVKIIGTHGVNVYSQANLTGKTTRHYQRGRILKVKALTHYHLTSRLVLTNGRYITGNKTFVIAK